MTTTTIRVSPRTRELLQELAQDSGISMQAVLESALEQYRRHQLLAATNAAYAELQRDTAARAELEHECADWDHDVARRVGGNTPLVTATFSHAKTRTICSSSALCVLRASAVKNTCRQVANSPPPRRTATRTVIRMRRLRNRDATPFLLPR